MVAAGPTDGPQWRRSKYTPADAAAGVQRPRRGHGLQNTDAHAANDKENGIDPSLVQNGKKKVRNIKKKSATDNDKHISVTEDAFMPWNDNSRAVLQSWLV
jgi:hypothetical protein